MSLNLKWDDSEVQAGLDRYYRTILEALHAIAAYYAPIVESEAKVNARWVDRTGHARVGLQGLVEDLSAETMAIVLKHGVSYGIHLELRNQGRYAIILPTLESHYSDINSTLQQVFGK